MKKIAAALIGLLALAVASGLLLFQRTEQKKSAAKDLTSEQSKQPYNPRGRGSQELRIADLAQRKTAAARDKLLQLYAAWAGKPEFDNDRRAIVGHIIRNEEPYIAINLIMAAVAADPIPLEDDDMLSTVARDMVALWKDDWYVGKGRDVLRLETNVKAKALLAESLAWRLNSPPGELTSVEGQRQQLASDLMQTYMHTNDTALKRRLLQNVEMVANADVAEVLANPENAEHTKLARTLDQERQQAAEAAFSLKGTTQE